VGRGRVGEELLGRYPYFLTALLLVVGLYGMLGKRNLLKKLIGMMVFQMAIFLFFIQGATKQGATLPILDPRWGTDPARYINPLPHVLILTAIVVAVAITGVSFALVLTIYRSHGTLDEEAILEQERKR
jgi:multicomponent Na+:H+ antiporter subunit C